MSASNDIVAQIYKICLSISLKRIGWVFDYNFRINVQQYISNKEMIYIIQKELSSTFEDIKRLRFKQMLKILKGIKKDNALSDKATYGIINYYYVVERMIDELFMGIDAEELKEFYPSAYWQLEDETEEPASLLRPDTIHKCDNHIYIIDSKMYKYGFTGEINDLPQTSSILKQISYSDYIKNSKKYENIRNIFIIPYDKELEKFKEKYKDEDFVYIGKAYGKWKNKNDESGYVFTFLIDYMYLLEQYNKNNADLVNELYIKINEKYKIQ